MMKSIKYMVMAFAAIAAFASCSEDELGVYESITIPSTFEVECGKSSTIEVVSAAPSGLESRIEWCEVEDLDECISINRISGEITAARAGQATIKAYAIDGSEVESNICTVSVTADISGNLVVGGTFESYANKTEVQTEWSLSNSNIEMEVGNVVSGTKSVRLTGVSTNVAIYQLVRALEPGATYEFGFSGRIQSSAGAAGVTATSDLEFIMSVRSNNDGAVGEQISSNISIKCATDDASEDTFLRGRVTIPDGVTTAYVHIYKAAGIGYVDDVFIRKVE